MSCPNRLGLLEGVSHKLQRNIWGLWKELADVPLDNVCDEHLLFHKYKLLLCGLLKDQSARLENDTALLCAFIEQELLQYWDKKTETFNGAAYIENVAHNLGILRVNIPKEEILAFDTAVESFDGKTFVPYFTALCDIYTADS